MKTSGVAAIHAEQDADGRGLAGSVGAEEAVDAAGGHVKVEAVEGAQPPEALGEAGDLDGGGSGGGAGRCAHGPRLACDVASQANRTPSRLTPALDELDQAVADGGGDAPVVRVDVADEPVLGRSRRRGQWCRRAHAAGRG